MMATGRRRTRQQIDDDDDDDDDDIYGDSPLPSRRTSQSPQARPGKRARTSEQTSRSGSTAADEDNEGIELLDADDDDDDEDPEEAEEWQQAATQRIQNEELARQQRRAGTTSKEALKSIELFNFMCHKRLEINLGEQINFIIGHNGSGKSAILTALTVALGGKATVTNRASSLKDFIKHGQQNAAVIVKILNGGDDPYKPELYGDVITVERRFSRDGSSGYKLKSKNDRIVSTKRDDLQEILDHYQFQIDNPMTVLAQDNARMFLGNSSVDDKYRLFMKGVQLLQLDADYAMMESTVTTMETTLESKKEALQELRNNDRRGKAQLQIFERSTEIENQVRLLQKKFAWVQVKGAEESLAADQERVKEAKENIEQCTTEIEAVKQKLNDFDSNVQEAKDRLVQVQNQAKDLDAEVVEAKASAEKVQAALTDLQANKEALETSFAEEEQIIKENEGKKKAEQEKENDHGERQRKQEESERLATQLEDWERRVLQSEAAIRNLEKQIKDRDMADKELRKRRQDLVQQVARANEEVQNLVRSKDDALGKFHNGMPNAFKEIQRHIREFRDPPIGPLGMHVKLKDPRDEDWVRILERMFGRNLNAFLVTNFEDRKRLEGILQRSRCDAPIIVSKRERFDYRSGEPDKKFKTVLDSLDINDEFVKRQLITHNHIESTILIADRQQADAVMHGHPRNVFACYARNKAGKSGWRVGGAAGGSGIAPVTFWQGATRISSTPIEQQIAEAKAVVRALQDDLEKLERETVQSTNDLRSLRKSHAVEKRSAEEAKTSKQRADAALEDVREYLNSQGLGSGRVVALQNAIDEAKAGQKLYLNQIRAIMAEVTEKAAEYKATEQVVNAKQAALDDHGRILEEAEAALANKMLERKGLTNAEAHWNSKLKENMKEYEKFKKAAQQSEEKRDVVLEKATQFCPERIPNEELTMTQDQIRDKMIRHTKALEEMKEQAGMTEDEARRKFESAHAQFTDAKVQMDNLEQTYNALYNALVERKRRFIIFRNSICTKAKELFTHLVSLRGYKGKLVVDHGKGQLKVKVDPGGKGTRKDPKSLSGGEKSFAQVCMLLAVWEAMGSPLRALDEFDVFMDAVNRKMAMGMMIECARSSTQKQFILITPQDMGNVAVGPDIRVHRMRDPERGQQAVLN